MWPQTSTVGIWVHKTNFLYKLSHKLFLDCTWCVFICLRTLTLKRGDDSTFLDCQASTSFLVHLNFIKYWTVEHFCLLLNLRLCAQGSIWIYVILEYRGPHEIFISCLRQASCMHSCDWYPVFCHVVSTNSNFLKWSQVLCTELCRPQVAPQVYKKSLQGAGWSHTRWRFWSGHCSLSGNQQHLRFLCGLRQQCAVLAVLQ